MKTLHDKNYDQLFNERRIETILDRTDTACDECGTELIFNNAFSFSFSGLNKGSVSTMDVECLNCGFKGKLII